MFLFLASLTLLRPYSRYFLSINNYIMVIAYQGFLKITEKIYIWLKLSCEIPV
jgi:hypothetical protein